MQPNRVAWGPTNTWSPTTTGKSAPPTEVALSTAFSHTMAHSPTSTSEASESSTAPYMILALGSTETRPIKTAVGATNAEASTMGSTLRCRDHKTCVTVPQEHDILEILK